MPARYRTHLFLGLLAFVCAQGWNRWNIQAMMAAPYAKHNVRDGRTLVSTDDASYLSAVDRLLGDRPDLEKGPLSDRPDLRAPGYRLWYLLPRLAFDPPASLTVLALLQCLLYACAVMVLWEAFITHGILPGIRWVMVLLFTIMPMFHGFLFHTITEGVTPALSLMVVCCALLGSRSVRWLWAGIAMWSLLTVTRPPLMWAGIALLPALWERWRSPARAILVMLLAFSPTALWWVGNMVKAGHYVGLHPVYRADEPGITRPTHGAFWELAKSWGARGDEFHPVMENAYRAALSGDTSAHHARAFVALTPPGSLSREEEAVIRSSFSAWQRFNHEQLAPALASPTGTIPFTTPEEERIISSLQHITHTWRGEHSFHHHVRVPLTVLGRLVAHSNLNLFLFQQEWRGRWWMEAFRWCAAALHLTLFIGVLLAALMRTPAGIRWTALGACSYLFYLAYAQRGVEERYTLPVLFIGVACAAFVLQRIVTPNFAARKIRRP